MAQVIKDVVTWLKQWFYTEDEVDTITGGLQTQINNKADSSTVSSLSTAVSGKAPTSHASTSNTYGLGTTSNYGHVKTINDLTTSSHSDGLALSAYQGKVLNDAIAGKANSSHNHADTEITISRSYAHIGTDTGVSQKDINDAVNIQLGALKNVNLIALVTGDLPSASADTMNKLYVKAKSGGATGDGYDIWVTIRTGSSSNYSYAWEKIDDFDLQNISISWDSVTSKPSTFPPEPHAHGNILTSGKLSGYRNPNIPLITTTDGLITGGSFGSTSGTFAEGNHTHSSYENPTIADNLTTNDATKVLSAKQGKVLNDNKADKTASIGTTITLVDKGETNEGCIIFNTIS